MWISLIEKGLTVNARHSCWTIFDLLAMVRFRRSLKRLSRLWGFGMHETEAFIPAIISGLVVGSIVVAIIWLMLS